MTTIDGRKTKALAVVCAAPMHLVHTIAFTPALNPRKLYMLQNMKMGMLHVYICRGGGYVMFIRSEVFSNILHPPPYS